MHRRSSESVLRRTTQLSRDERIGAGVSTLTGGECLSRPLSTACASSSNAGIALRSELSLDALLQQLVETAARLTAPEYAALSVIDQTATGLERFLTTGIDLRPHAAIGDLPRGRGILDARIRETEPLRLHNLGDDPRSVGFPAGHLPMKCVLSVPVLLRGVAYGNLHLTEKLGGGDFTESNRAKARARC